MLVSFTTPTVTTNVLNRKASRIDQRRIKASLCSRRLSYLPLMYRQLKKALSFPDETCPEDVRAIIHPSLPYRILCDPRLPFSPCQEGRLCKCWARSGRLYHGKKAMPCSRPPYRLPKRKELVGFNFPHDIREENIPELAAVFAHQAVVAEDEVGILPDGMRSAIGMTSPGGVRFVQPAAVNVDLAALYGECLARKADHALHVLLGGVSILSEHHDVAPFRSDKVVDVFVHHIICPLWQCRVHANVIHNPDAHDIHPKEVIHHDGPEEDKGQSVGSPLLRPHEARIKERPIVFRHI